MQETLSAFKSAVQREPELVPRPGTWPALVGSTPQGRPLAIKVKLLAATLAGRLAAYNALVSACGTGYPMVPVGFVEGGDTYTWQAHCSGPVVDDWYEMATIAAYAPDPEAVVT